MEALTAVGVGLVGVFGTLAGVLLQHRLKRAERREAAQEQFVKERMAAWARLHGEALRNCGKIMYLTDLVSNYEAMVAAFLSAMHLLEEPSRTEIWERLGRLGIHTGVVQAQASGLVPADAGTDSHAQALQEFNELYQLINRSHLEAAKRFFECRSQ